MKLRLCLRVCFYYQQCERLYETFLLNCSVSFGFAINRSKRVVFVFSDPRTPLDEEDHGASRNLVTSFVWHPDEENCIVATRKDGRLAECHAMERIAPSWSSQHFLMWPQNGILRSYDKDCQLFDEIDDISLLMKNRAAKGSFTKKHNLQDDDQVPDAIKSGRS